MQPMSTISRSKTVRGERRAALRSKKISAPRGGTRAGQAARLETQRHFSGLPKALKPRVRVRIGKMEL